MKFFSTHRPLHSKSLASQRLYFTCPCAGPSLALPRARGGGCHVGRARVILLCSLSDVVSENDCQCSQMRYDSVCDSMDRNADLDHALAFGVERIEEEATRSGEPLTAEQRFLLNNLP